jgi:hypothetical protein
MRSFRPPPSIVTSSLLLVGDCIEDSSSESNPWPNSEQNPDDVHRTTKRIIGFFHARGQLSHYPIATYVRIEVENEIHKIANLLVDIALQFGVYATLLRLSCSGSR